MTKRRPTAPRLVDMPHIIEGLTREAEQYAAIAEEDLWWEQIAATLPDAHMWWVTAPMAALAHAYAPEIPAWDLAAVRPSLTGVLLWEGSSGQEWSTTDETGHTSRGPIVGAWWGVWDDTPQVIPLARTADIPHTVPGDLIGFGPLIHDDTRATDAWMRMLGATLILAQTETVSTRHRRAPGIPMPRKPSEQSLITKVVLRETVRTIHTETVDEERDKKWQLKNRHLVRGHWRQQACGPNRELRRPTFVPPYIKGPADGELRLTQEVKVWRR